MNIIDYKYRKVPEYYPTMYMDGFTPDEILYAHKRKTMRDFKERERQANIEKEFEKEVGKALEKALDDLLKDFSK